MRMRVLAAGLAFRETRPIELSERFLSKKDAKRVARELRRLRRRDPLAVAFCHQSPWHVPIRWFALFVEEERRLGEDEHGQLRLRYRTTARKALRRAGQTIPLLRRSDLGPIGDLLMDLHEWIALFDARSLVELDYGGLCDFLTWDELDDDRSVRDLGLVVQVHTGMARLHGSQPVDLDPLLAEYPAVTFDLFHGGYPWTRESYQGVLSNWAEIRGHELLN